MKKNDGLIAKLIFLGTDTMGQTFRLLVYKMDNLKVLINYAIEKHKVTLLDLQQLAGYLNFSL